MKNEDSPIQKSSRRTCAKLGLVAALLLGAYVAGKKLGVQGVHLKIVKAWNEFFVDHDPSAELSGTVQSGAPQDDPFGSTDDPFGTTDDPFASK